MGPPKNTSASIIPEEGGRNEACPDTRKKMKSYWNVSNSFTIRRQEPFQLVHGILGILYGYQKFITTFIDCFYIFVALSLVKHC